MKNFYSLVLLIFGAFAVTTTFASNSWIPPQFKEFQHTIDLLSTSTFDTFKDLHAKIEHSRKNEITKLKIEEQIQEQEFSQKSKELIEKSIENGKDTANIQKCVNTAHEMYLTDLMMNHKKILNCINEATNNAKDKVKYAKKVFQSHSFESPVRAVQNDFVLRRCYEHGNQDCINRKVAEYQKRINVTSKASKEAIQSSMLTNDEHHTAMYKCVGDQQKKFVELQKNSSEILTKCISD